jgi:hypothetical protein
MRRPILTALATAAAAAAVAAPASAAPPANDDFESASPTSGTIAGRFTEATRQAGEPEHGSQSLWYAFRPSTSGRYAVQPAPGANFALVNVYTGDSLAGLRRTAAHDPQVPRVPFEAVAGTTYRIAVASSYEGSTDAFSLRVVPAPFPANDDFATARTVKIPGRYTDSLADATDELGEPDNAGGKPHHTLWYRFRATRTGRLSIQASSRDCGASVTAYTGSELSSLRKRAGAVGRTLRFRARRGVTYRLAVDCPSNSVQPFQLTFSDGSVVGKGVTIEPVAGQTIDSVLERGLRTVVEAKRKTTVGIDLLVSAATARELGLKQRVLGHVSGTLGYRQKLPATIRLTSAARKALAGEQSLSAVLRLTLQKSDAPNRVLTVPVELPN